MSDPERRRKTCSDMIKNRTSPKKPLIAALGVACLSIFHSLGYRGKYRPSVAPLSLEEAVLLFLVVFFCAFVVFYPLRMLGVRMGAWGGKEEEADPDRQRTTRGM